MTDTAPVHRRAPFILGFLLVALLAITVIATGGASAADVEVNNSTVDVDGTTDTVYVEVNNTNATTNATVSVEFVHIANDTGTETALNWTNATVSNDSKQLLESEALGDLEDLDVVDNDTVEATVYVDDATVPAADLELQFGTFEDSGAGGGGIGGSTTSIGILAVVAGSALLLFSRRD